MYEKISTYALCNYWFNVFILAFSSLIIVLGSRSRNRQMEIEVENVKNFIDDIKANMDNIKRCSEISLNGYTENLIYYSGF